MSWLRCHILRFWQRLFFRKIGLHAWEFWCRYIVFRFVAAYWYESVWTYWCWSSDLLPRNDVYNEQTFDMFLVLMRINRPWIFNFVSFRYFATLKLAVLDRSCLYCLFPKTELFQRYYQYTFVSFWKSVQE